jgi:hypothetical protein
MAAPDVGDHRHVMDDVAQRRHPHDQYLLHAQERKTGQAVLRCIERGAAKNLPLRFTRYTSSERRHDLDALMR